MLRGEDANVCAASGFTRLRGMSDNKQTRDFIQNGQYLAECTRLHNEKIEVKSGKRRRKWRLLKSNFQNTLMNSCRPRHSLFNDSLKKSSSVKKNAVNTVTSINSLAEKLCLLTSGRCSFGYDLADESKMANFSTLFGDKLNCFFSAEIGESRQLSLQFVPQWEYQLNTAEELRSRQEMGLEARTALALCFRPASHKRGKRSHFGAKTASPVCGHMITHPRYYSLLSKSIVADFLPFIPNYVMFCSCTRMIVDRDCVNCSRSIRRAYKQMRNLLQEIASDGTLNAAMSGMETRENNGSDGQDYLAQIYTSMEEEFDNGKNKIARRKPRRSSSERWVRYSRNHFKLEKMLLACRKDSCLECMSELYPEGQSGGPEAPGLLLGRDMSSFFYPAVSGDLASRHSESDVLAFFMSLAVAAYSNPFMWIEALLNWARNILLNHLGGHVCSTALVSVLDCHHRCLDCSRCACMKRSWMSMDMPKKGPLFDAVKARQHLRRKIHQSTSYANKHRFS